MNKEQYKEYFRRHTKDLQRIKLLHSYNSFLDSATWNATAHEAEIVQDELDELIIEVLGTINDHCNKETGYHSTPHIGCILR